MKENKKVSDKAIPVSLIWRECNGSYRHRHAGQARCTSANWAQTKNWLTYRDTGQTGVA